MRLLLPRSSRPVTAIRRGIALAAVTGAVVAFGAAPAQAAPSYQVTYTLAGGIAKSLPNPAASPPGVNVPGCRPSAAHPRPVVLVNGTLTNMIDDWAGLGPRLANLGYCVYGTPIGGDPNLFIQTIGPVVTSAKQISTFVDSVLARTGADEVDLIGHSQGGLIAEYYLKLLGGAVKVNTFVGLSPTTHGTTLSGLLLLAEFFPGANDVVGVACPACVDQERGSTVVKALENGPIAQPGVKYTIIETRNEAIVTPAGTAAFIQEPGVKNIWLQSACPFNWTDHLSLTYDVGVYSLVRNALDPAHASSIRCL